MSCGIQEPIPEQLQEAVAGLFGAERIFCLQKHHASSLHWDFRLQLEHGDVMPSWAVPKGLPETSEDGNRLGIRVEDHPLAYATFHGNIPEGYGAGQVELVDVGPIEILQADEKYIKVRLDGQVHKGVWSLRNTKGKNWIIRRSE